MTTLRDALLARLAEIREAAEASTPGPWEVGDRYGVAGVLGSDGACAYCRSSEPIWTGRRDINGTVMLAHVHRWDQAYGTDLTHFDGAGSVVQVTTPNDYGSGVGEVDARFMVAARSVLGPLVEGLAEEVGRHRPTERAHPNPGGPAWTERVCYECRGGNADLGCDFVRRWADRLGVAEEEGA